MADSDVDIKISGDSAGAQAAFKQAADAAKAAAGSINTAFEGVGGVLDTLREHFVAITAILAGGAAFKESIAATKEFVGNVTALSKAAGISAQEASGLNVALEDIGSSADTYTGALSKLTRQVRTNETGLNAMGIATRGSNGEFLDGRELMNSAITTLNTYKEGTDRNLAAQVAFGKGAADSAALLKLNTQIQEEGAKKAEELNLVIGPGTQAAVKAYKMAMNDVGDVMKGVEVTLGKAVMPVLTDLAQWFSSIGPSVIAIFKPAAAGIADTMRIVIDVVKDLLAWFGDTFTQIGAFLEDTSGITLTFGEFVRNAFSVVGIALLFLKESFQVAFQVIKTAIDIVIISVRAWVEVIEAAFHRDWAGAKAAYKAGLADIETEVRESAKRIIAIDEETSAAQEKLAQGQGYKRPEDKDGEVKKPAGSRQFKDPNAGADGPTLMARYEAELAMVKLSIDQSNAAYGTYYTLSKAAESAFWTNKLATVSAASKEYPQIQKKSIDAQLAASKEAFDGQLALLNKQEEAAKYDYDQKIALASQEVAMLRQHYLEDSKEVQAGLEKVTKLKQQQAEQTKKIAEVEAQARRDAALGGLDLEEQRAQLEVDLGQKTQAQLIADLVGFENRRYAIQVQAMTERLAIVMQEGNPVEKAQAYAQLEALDTQHQQKLTAIDGQAVQERSKYANAAVLGVSDAFGQALNAMLMHTQSFSKTMQSLFTTIGQSIIQELVTKPLAAEVANMVRRTALYQTFAGTKAATDLTSSAETIATKKVEAVGVISADTGEAAMGAAAAMASVPYVGPILAAAAYADMLALGASAGAIASASGGFDIPGSVNPITQLHAREMVLPETLADRVRAVTPGEGNTNGGGDIHLHVHATDAQSVKRLFMNNGEHIAASLRAQRRSFNAT